MKIIALICQSFVMEDVSDIRLWFCIDKSVMLSLMGLALFIPMAGYLCKCLIDVRFF